MVEVKRICRGTCKKFRVTKPRGMGRYEAGQGHCQMCNMWIDHRGAHTKLGTVISMDSDGWFCNCCNYRVRRKPRNIKYKMKLRGSNITQNTNIEDESDSITVDLSYFSKQRATMMKSMAICILKGTSHAKIENCLFDDFSISKLDIEIEFNTPLDEIIKLAQVLDPPNKMSMILEFERVKSLIGVAPTKIEFEENEPVSL